MTVAEMITELQKLPQDAPVRVEAYYPDAPDDENSGESFVPCHIEAVRNEERGVSVILWAYDAPETN